MFLVQNALRTVFAAAARKGTLCAKRSGRKLICVKKISFRNFNLTSGVASGVEEVDTLIKLARNEEAVRAKPLMRHFGGLSLKTVLNCQNSMFSPMFCFFQTDTAGLIEVALGGAFYVSGVFFFKSDGKIAFAHAIWHVFCAMGACFHFYAVYTHLY